MGSYDWWSIFMSTWPIHRRKVGEEMMEILASIGLVLVILLTLIGNVTFILWLRSPKEPADTSNRINTIILWWFAISRTELFLDKDADDVTVIDRIKVWWKALLKPHTFVDRFDWLRYDVLDNFEKKE